MSMLSRSDPAENDGGELRDIAASYDPGLTGDAGRGRRLKSPETGSEDSQAIIWSGSEIPVIMLSMTCTTTQSLSPKHLPELVNI
jgi:hypothetical protein